MIKLFYEQEKSNEKKKKKEIGLANNCDLPQHSIPISASPCLQLWWCVIMSIFTQLVCPVNNFFFFSIHVWLVPLLVIHDRSVVTVLSQCFAELLLDTIIPPRMPHAYNNWHRTIFRADDCEWFLWFNLFHMSSLFE